MSVEITSKSVQKVEEVLKRHGLSTKIVQFPESTRTAQEAANAIGCDVAHIVKSLIFSTEKTHQPILVLTSGVNRVNEKLIEQLMGEKIKKADAEFTRNVTGFAIGGVPPFGHLQKITTFIDQDLLQYETVWAAAGTPHTVFSLVPSDLERITQGIVVKVNN
jgi:prolyl-tRNA editing enzyme YbaK/EbsC (Cys-tRNA(Pro) deacylase)